MMKRYIVAFSLLLISIILAVTYPNFISWSAPPRLENKLVLGEKEWVRIVPLTRNLKARIDTGAKTSSLSASEIEPFEKEGKSWVRFRIEHKRYQSILLELPVERKVKILQSSQIGFEKRYVVKIPLSLGNVTEMTEFTLRDRSHLAFPILIGRSFLDKNAIVDVSQEFVQKKP